MSKKLFIAFSLVGLLVFNSCETKFSLNGDYKKIPIVFGLINQHDSVHMVKITRTFLGDGNNYEFAQVADSNYFNQVDAQVIELDNGVETGRVWQLHDTTITNKETGTFYGPEQKLYVFYANDLISSHEYKLIADLDEGTYNIDATTDLIDNFTFDGTVTNSTSPIVNFSYSDNQDNYKAYTLKYSEGTNVALYHFNMILHWTEYYLDGSTTDKSTVWFVGDKDIAGGIQIQGLDFFNFIKENINSDANVAKRIFIGIEFEAIVASEDLVKYMEISKPTSSLSTSTPKYTNINSDDEALGLFTAREILKLETGNGTTMINLSDKTIETLCTDPITSGLKFCSTLPSHISAAKPFICN